MLRVLRLMEEGEMREGEGEGEGKGGEGVGGGGGGGGGEEGERGGEEVEVGCQ